MQGAAQHIGSNSGLNGYNNSLERSATEPSFSPLLHLFQSDVHSSLISPINILDLVCMGFLLLNGSKCRVLTVYCEHVTSEVSTLCCIETRGESAQDQTLDLHVVGP